MTLRVLALLAGCLGMAGCGGMIPTMGASPDTSCLTLTTQSTVERNQMYVVKGSVQNNCQRAYSNVTVRFTLAFSEAMGSPAKAFGYIPDLKPGEVKTFESQAVSNPSIVFDKITAN